MTNNFLKHLNALTFVIAILSAIKANSTSLQNVFRTD